MTSRVLLITVPPHAAQAVDGRPMKRLRAAGYTAKVLRKVSFTLYELPGLP